MSDLVLTNKPNAMLLNLQKKNEQFSDGVGVVGGGAAVWKERK